MMKSSMKKSELANWILDFFRRANCRAGEMVIFRNFQIGLSKLNLREKKMFADVASELIKAGYISFEQSPVQCLRLTKKGEEYIYTDDAKLECCADVHITTQEDYKNLIGVGTSLLSLEHYQNVLETGQLIEDFNRLQYMPFEYKKDNTLMIETLKEYYEKVYNTFLVICRLICTLDEENLLKILDEYILMMTKTLSKYSTFRRSIMIERMKQIWLKSKDKISGTEIENHLEKLRQVIFF